MTRSCPRCTTAFTPPHPRSREARCPSCVDAVAQEQRAQLASAPVAGTWQRIAAVSAGYPDIIWLADGTELDVSWSTIASIAKRCGVQNERLRDLDVCVRDGVVVGLRKAVT